MKKTRYIKYKDDIYFHCKKCGDIDYGTLPTSNDGTLFLKRCKCGAIVKTYKNKTVTRKGIIAVQTRYNFHTKFYDAHSKKFIGHTQCIKRLNAKELSNLIDGFIYVRRITKEKSNDRG